MYPKLLRMSAALILAIFVSTSCSALKSDAQASSGSTTTLQAAALPDPFAWNPNHLNITTTYEQGGTPAGPSDHHISNESSAWYTDWSAHLCGPDLDGTSPAQPDCDSRYYFALPCGDYDNTGPVLDHVAMSPWKQAEFKNKWIEVRSNTNGRSVFVQWEDVGPLDNPNDNDCNYVFGNTLPAMRGGIESALDISPAAFKWLTDRNLDIGVIRTDWRFVPSPPDGPWLHSGITDSQPDW